MMIMMKASMLFLYRIKSNCLSFADVKKSSFAQQRINRWQSSLKLTYAIWASNPPAE